MAIKEYDKHNARHIGDDRNNEKEIYYINPDVGVGGDGDYWHDFPDSGVASGQYSSTIYFAIDPLNR